MSAATLGEIRRDASSFVVDALPHIMPRVRKLLPQGCSGGGGKHTHNVITVSRTPDAAKDILWLADRYPMNIEAEVATDLEFLSARYDRKLEAAALGDKNQLFDLTPQALTMAEPPRPHQIGARNLWLQVGRLMVADAIGLGKTITGISFLCEPETRPALIVVQPFLISQWVKQIKRFLPGATVHAVKKAPHDLPKVDIVVIGYSRLRTWEDRLVPHGFKTVLFDEVQELRHLDTEKRRVARALSQQADRTAGFTGTPIYNLGAEVWSVIDAIAPDELGPRNDFLREYCTGDSVRDPLAVHSRLVTSGLMLRRTRESLGIKSDPVTREVITLEGDLEGLKRIQDVAAALARSVLRNEVGVSDDASRELDWKLRQATGVAKARAVAEFVRQLVQSGEKVVLAGWHRECYSIWEKDLRDLNPVMFTGSESPAAKNAAVKAFTENKANVFILSLRSGAGLDGLQKVASNVVFGELDWSPQVMDQVIGRLDREGQTKPVTAYWLTIDDGSDPFILELLTDKTSQSEGVVDGKVGEAVILEDNGSRSDRIREMATAYLASIGEAPPVVEPQTGLHAEVVAALRRLKLPTNSETEMQLAIADVLPGMLRSAEVEREAPVTKRSRLDFLVHEGEERIAIECKIDQTGRGNVYAQVRRYAEEANITGCIILAPWGGVSDFVVDGVPVTVVDYTKQGLRAGAR